MTADRRPVGLPSFSAPAADAPAQTEPRRLPPVERAVFLSAPELPEVPETTEEAELLEAEFPVQRSAARRLPTPGSMTFSAPERQG
ncbi:hypothetical protein [Kitasatospora kifunensis]|uniref:Uncharacterized protein n=1 Tax=Kitasatospora kifunensis TaxID=58351 RepID=A0A7W7QY31_KITKI|nr:hypothetical protein [Kitasatospora kifunensis]MBB4921266.1 hypothetical protein [Kitasatospora kifunensis]